MLQGSNIHETDEMIFEEKLGSLCKSCFQIRLNASINTSLMCSSVDTCYGMQIPFTGRADGGNINILCVVIFPAGWTEYPDFIRWFTINLQLLSRYFNKNVTHAAEDNQASEVEFLSKSYSRCGKKKLWKLWKNVLFGILYRVFPETMNHNNIHEPSGEFVQFV